ncbi:sigma-70 family RNA polymerase sigma factor [Alicyclobacillus curvatus]|jgi:RNA polymerase sigma-70 factor, ECF subfamily|nr:sigma-70 family RNA polymerase sigma factor [Alicyclobacillus curvatus]
MSDMSETSSDAVYLLRRWMEQYGTDVINFAYSYVRNYHQAQDIAQDVFLRAFQNAHTFRGDSAVKTWLLSITANRCKDYLRSWHTRHEMLQKEDWSADDIADADTESTVLGKLSRDEVWERVNELPLKYREVVVLYYLRDLSTKEVAEVLSVSDEAVRTRLHRGRALLRQMLEEAKL